MISNTWRRTSVLSVKEAVCSISVWCLSSLASSPLTQSPPGATPPWLVRITVSVRLPSSALTLIAPAAWRPDSGDEMIDELRRAADYLGWHACDRIKRGAMPSAAGCST